MLSWKQYFENQRSYIGDSNPLGSIWIDTWHQAQKQAFIGNIQSAISMMQKASQLAWRKSPGEAKYYLGTAAWLAGDVATCLAMSKDNNVIQTGNEKVLLRLLNSKTSNYKQAYENME